MQVLPRAILTPCYAPSRRVADGPGGVRGKRRAGKAKRGHPPTTPRASCHRAPDHTHERPPTRRPSSFRRTTVPELAICLDCGAMTAAPASGPMLCAACGTRRKATTTPRKRTHEERRSSPEALERRATARRFYSSAIWRRVRDQVRERDGECLTCGATSDLTVDHVIPRAIAPELAYEPANLRTLCRSCHGRKDGARAKHYRPRRSPLMDSERVPSVLREGA